MTSHFDSEQGRLVMSRRAIQGLALLAAGPDSELDPEIVRELEEAGIVREGRVQEALTALARCVARPMVRLSAERVGDPAVQVSGWIDERLAVLMLTPSRSSEGDVVAVPRGM